MFNRARAKCVALLRWSERYTKTDMVYLASGGSWLLLNQGVGNAVGLLISIIFANLFPVEAYGVYKYILSIGALFTGLSLTGMNTSLIRAVARGNSAVVPRSFRFQLVWNLWVIMPAALAVSGYYLLNANTVLAVSMLILGFLLPLNNAANTFSALLVGEKRYRTVFFSNLALNAVNVAAIVGTVLITHSVPLLVATTLTLQTLTLFFIYRRTMRGVPHTADPRVEQPVFTYGKHLSFINIAGILAQNIDKVLTFHWLGAAPLALYHFATAIPGPLGGIGKNIANLSLPKLSAHGGNVSYAAILSKIWRIMLVFGIIVGFYILAAPYLFHILFSPYQDAIWFSQIFSVSLVFSVPTLFLVSVLQAREATRKLYQFNIGTAVAQIVLIVPFVFYAGLTGLILARIIGSVLTFLCALQLIKMLPSLSGQQQSTQEGLSSLADDTERS